VADYSSSDDVTGEITEDATREYDYGGSLYTLSSDYVFDRARSGRSTIATLEGDNLKEGYSVEDMFADAGLYLTPNSEVKVWRVMIGLPAVDLSTGFLNINSAFSFATKLQKWNFNTEGSNVGTEADNSPAYLGDYQEWEAWRNSPSGYDAVTYTGYEDYRNFYDWFDSEFTYLGQTGEDENIQQRYHKVDPVSPSYAAGTINQWVNYPYVNQTKLQEYLDADMNNFSDSDFVPQVGEKGAGGSFGGHNPWDSDGRPDAQEWFAQSDVVASGYESASTYRVPWRYHYNALMTAISARFIPKSLMQTRYQEFVKHACGGLVSQKLITSDRFSGPRQTVSKVRASSLSVIGSPATTETLIDRGEATGPSSTTTFTSATY